uniref:NADH-ubiquinone oxidoreductase chain 4 n=1 Tax=Pachybrachis sp. ReAss_5 TaxID=1934909 RepID=A0A3G1GPS2_9CUCU|nr:NADH dehydrogenase subunit 4 [Pachybrachis sp. ReAss_5]
MMKFLFALMFLIPAGIFNLPWVVCSSLFLICLIFMVDLNYEFFFSHISWLLGCDLLSFLMIILSFWVCGLMFMASGKLIKLNYFVGLFSVTVLLLMVSLFMTFSSMNLFIFYLFFEISLIPTFLLIVGWGYQPERLEAGLYLLFYTLVFSLPMMAVIFYLYQYEGSLIIDKLNFQMDNVFGFLCMNMVFFVKIPMYFVHLWLPKAHVEAPVSGSMILAGVMLKLGGYGLLRFMKLFMKVGFSINIYIILISLIGGFLVSLICLRQSDMKSLIAYSSVAHMGLVLSGIMTFSVWGFSGAVILMLGHGLCSSGLFCLANISYERSLSRSVYLNKGMMNFMPSLSFWWFMFLACNMAAPPSLNLLGEITLFNSIVSYSDISMIFLMLMSFFSAGYSLFLYAYTQHGGFSSGLFTFNTGLVREYLLMLLHWAPLNLLVLKGDLLFNF